MPIELWTGMQGAGKTYCMVKEAIIPALADSRWLVLSNLDVTHPKTGKRTIDVTTGAGEQRVIDFPKVAELIDHNLDLPNDQRRNVLLAVDEIGMAMPQEMWKSQHVHDVIAIVLQLRKARVDFVGTVQHFERAVKVLRDNCNVVHQTRLFTRTWLWWHRDEHGPLNRRTGKPYKLAWLFEVDSVTPAGVGLPYESPRHKRESAGGRRKVKFDRNTAAAYDTFQRQASFATATGLATSSTSDADTDDPADIAARVIDLKVAHGELVAPDVKQSKH